MAKSNRARVSPLRKASLSAVQLDDDFCNLKQALRAVTCLEGLLTPIYLTPPHEQFSIEPGDLRALVAVINAELVRCTEPVDASIRSLRKALKHKVH